MQSCMFLLGWPSPLPPPSRLQVRGRLPRHPHQHVPLRSAYVQDQRAYPSVSRLHRRCLPSREGVPFQTTTKVEFEATRHMEPLAAGRADGGGLRRNQKEERRREPSPRSTGA